MAEIAMGGDGTLSAPRPGPEHQISGLILGETFTGPGLAYVKASDGLVYMATGAAANEAARVFGWVQMKGKAGQACTLWTAGRIAYGPNVAGTPTNPGTPLFLSGTVAGRFADAASTGGTTEIARVIDTDGRIQLKLGM